MQRKTALLLTGILLFSAGCSGIFDGSSPSSNPTPTELNQTEIAESGEIGLNPAVSTNETIGKTNLLLHQDIVNQSGPYTIQRAQYTIYDDTDTVNSELTTIRYNPETAQFNGTLGNTRSLVTVWNNESGGYYYNRANGQTTAMTNPELEILQASLSRMYLTADVVENYNFSYIGYGAAEYSNVSQQLYQYQASNLDIRDENETVYRSPDIYHTITIGMTGDGRILYVNFYTRTQTGADVISYYVGETGEAPTAYTPPTG